MVTVPTAKDDELASFGNFLPYYLLQPLRVPDGIGCIKYQSRFYEKRLRAHHVESAYSPQGPRCGIA